MASAQPIDDSPAGVPSGASQAAASAGVPAGAPPAAATITPYRDGPLLVRGPVKLVDQDGRPIDVGRATVALCRCGRSRIKPFCDGTHRAAGFRAPSGAEPRERTP